MGPCSLSTFYYISNKMQRYTVYLYLGTALHVSGGTYTHHHVRKQLYLQDLVFVTPLLLPAAIIFGNCSTCFGWYLHPSSGEQTTVSTASGICHTVTATCHYYIWKLLYMFRVVPPPIIRRGNNCIYSIWYLSHRYCYLPLLYLETALHVSGGTSTHHQESKQLYLKHLVFVTLLLLPASIVEEFQLFHDKNR